MGYSNDPARAGLPWMAFDIETAPIPNCGQYLDSVHAPENYKDPVKILQYCTDKAAKQIADAGLDLDLCEIVAIAWHMPVASDSPAECAYCQILESWSEGDMLDGFWRFVRTIQREGGTLVGFNCLGFDLPVLLRRSLYLGVDVPEVRIDKYRHEGVVDVAHELTYGGRMTWRSLAFYCRRFSIPHDDSVKGEDIAGLVQAKNWTAVEAHCRSDVQATAALAVRCGLIHQPQPAEVA